MDPDWLTWAKGLQALAQNGLTFAQSGFDVERYEKVRRIAAEMMAAGSDQRPESIDALFADQAGYATPKVDVRGAAFRDGQVLLVREIGDGGWTLPGGWADVNESPREAIVKEVREESGFEVEVTKLAAVYDRRLHPHHPPMPFHVYKLFFLCAITGGEARPSIETSEVGFFSLDALPTLSVARVVPAQIRRMAEHWVEPGMPTDFD
ncbi:MAG: NUDIX hydrolase [Kiloniellales bacterium]|nr:NUDIX hydrolase [Kiloniellales bacterium]